MLASIALGDKCPGKEFFRSLRDVDAADMHEVDAITTAVTSKLNSPTLFRAAPFSAPTPPSPRLEARNSHPKFQSKTASK